MSKAENFRWVFFTSEQIRTEFLHFISTIALGYVGDNIGAQYGTRILRLKVSYMFLIHRIQTQSKLLLDIIFNILI